MPRTDIELIRRRQLIDAVLEVTGDYGFQGTTMGRISAQSGMSVGIVSHYFGSKQGLLEAAMRHLLSELHKNLMSEIASRPNSPHDRLMAILETNFSNVQTNSKSALTWIVFWGQSAHDPELARLQRVNERRLYSNLIYSLRPLLPESWLHDEAQTIAALIDGFWLRSAMSRGRIDFERGLDLCKAYIDQLLAEGQKHRSV